MKPKLLLAIAGIFLLALSGCNQDLNSTSDPESPEILSDAAKDALSEKNGASTVEIAELPMVYFGQNSLAKTSAFTKKIYGIGVYARSTRLALWEIPTIFKTWVDLGYYVGTTSSDAVYATDLNQGSGGKYIYIIGVFKDAGLGNITNFQLKASSNQADAYNSNFGYSRMLSMPVPSNQTNLNLNQDAGGNFIYAHLSNSSASTPASEIVKYFIFVVANKSMTLQQLQARYPYPTTWSLTDLNSGARGMFIYMGWVY